MYTTGFDLEEGYKKRAQDSAGNPIVSTWTEQLETMPEETPA